MVVQEIIWLLIVIFNLFFRDHEVHEKVKKERYDFETPREEIAQYESEKEDGSGEDNSQNAQEDDNDD